MLINWNTIKILLVIVMDRLQTSEELQDKTSFIDPSIGVEAPTGKPLDQPIWRF